MNRYALALLIVLFLAGIAALSLVYAAGWARGIRTYWIRRAS